MCSHCVSKKGPVSSSDKRGTYERKIKTVIAIVKTVIVIVKIVIVIVKIVMENEKHFYNI